MRRFECVEGNASKFWEVAVDGDAMTVRYGRIGTNGQTQTKSFASAVKAQAEHDKLIREKTGKGYVEVDAGCAPAPARPTPPEAGSARDAAAPVGAGSARDLSVGTGQNRGQSPLPQALQADAAGPQSTAGPAPVSEPQPPGEFRWTPAWRKALPVWRGEAFAAPPPLDQQTQIADFAARLQALRGHGMGQRMLGNLMLRPGTPMDVAMLDPALLATCTDAAHWEDLMRIMMAYTSSFVGRTPLPDVQSLWQLCASMHGLRFALGVLCAAVTERGRLHPGTLDVWGMERLRAHIAALPDDDYAALREDAIARAAREEIAGLMAYLFPTEPVLVAPAVDALPPRVAGYQAAMLMACRLDSAQGERVYASTAGYDHSWPVWRPLHLNLARLKHPRALEFALDGLQRQHTQDWRRAALDLIRAHDSVGALDALLARVDDKAARPVLDEFAGHWPQLAIRLAAERLGTGADKPLRDWLERFVAAHRAALAATRVRADATTRPLLDRLVAGLPAQLPEAPPDALPDWLRGPPWRTGRPAKAPKLPSFWRPAGYARPLLRDGRALPESVLDAIGEWLVRSPLQPRDASLDSLRALCQPASLGAFAWDLLQSWLDAGAPAKEHWAFAALAHLGDDECARRLARLLRVWPTEGASSRAASGLDVLAAMGSDVALMQLHGIAQKVRSKPLQLKAQEKLDRLALALGLSADELADRLVPDLGLDEEGSLRLDFGPRQFAVGFDEHLRPQVRDASGALLKDLPAPLKSDDAALAEAAVARFKALKKDARTLAGQQLMRLESAMVQRRRWSADEFRQLFVEHPLMRHLARRLLWARFADDQPVQCLRVAEDLSFADANDDLLTVPDDAEIGLVHALEMAAEDAAAFGQIFADYEILQPFAQIGREVYRLDDHERAASALTRFVGRKVATGSLVGLDGRGWRRDELTSESGRFADILCPLADGVRARLSFSPGAWIGDVRSEPVQTLGAIDLEGRANWGEIDAILVSEVLRDVARMAEVR